MVMQPDGSFISTGGLPVKLTQPEPGPLTRAASAQASAAREIGALRAEMVKLLPALGIADGASVAATATLDLLPAAARDLAPRILQVSASLGELERIMRDANQTIEVLRSERGQLQSLCVIAEHLNSILDRATLFEHVLADLILLVRAERAAILLTDPTGHLRFEAACQSDGRRLGRSDYDISMGAVEETWRTQQAIVIDDAQTDALVGENPSVRGQMITSIMCAPLRAQSKALGIVYVDRRAGPGTFTNSHLDLLAAFCNEAAIAIENASLFATQQRHLQEINAMKTYPDSILASISSGVLATDNDGRVTRANRAIERILSITQQEAFGRPLDQVLAVIEDPMLHEQIRQTIGAQDVSQTKLVRATVAGRGGPLTLSVGWSALIDSEQRRLGTAIVIDDLTDLQQAQHAAQIFRRYVHPDVVDLVTQNPNAAELGGQTREISVVFADIRNFTKLGENMAPADLVVLLNDYLALLTEAIFQVGGTVTMFQGDAVMAIFNAPSDQPDHAARAVRAAWAMRRAIEDYRQRTGNRPVEFGIGVNTGMALVGNIGARDRLQNYTAIGDAVNCAKRIQEQSKANQVLLSAITHERVAPLVMAHRAGDVQAKGKSQPIRVWELSGIVP